MFAPAAAFSIAASGSAAATGPSSASSQTHSAAAAQASEQPRNHNAEPSPSANSDRDPANGPPPAADRLHRHALESVFAFLGLREVATSLRVCHGWLVAVRSMRRMDLSLWLPSVALDVLAQSTMGRHVGELGNVSMTAATLAVLADRMAHLRALTCRLLVPSPFQAAPPVVPLVFPAALRRLSVRWSGPVGAPEVNAAIAVVARLPLLEQLCIEATDFRPLLSFAPLAAAEQLCVLEIRRYAFQYELSDAHVDQLRTLPWLEEFYVPMDTPLLRRLLRQPHDLRWKRISVPNPLDDEVAALLPQLPSLTRIDTFVQCERFDWLRGLPNLTDVRLWLSTEGDAGRAESLVAGLQCCTNIQILSLRLCTDLTVAHLANLLPRLLRLRELTLISLSVDSLSFLARPPMTNQLSSLDLSHCQRLPLADLHHVHALRGLRKLVLSCSFTTPLDDHAQSLLTPPSAALPLLREFSYRAD